MQIVSGNERTFVQRVRNGDESSRLEMRCHNNGPTLNKYANWLKTCHSSPEVPCHFITLFLILRCVHYVRVRRFLRVQPVLGKSQVEKAAKVELLNLTSALGFCNIQLLQKLSKLNLLLWPRTEKKRGCGPWICIFLCKSRKIC